MLSLKILSLCVELTRDHKSMSDAVHYCISGIMKFRFLLEFHVPCCIWKSKGEKTAKKNRYITDEV